MREVGRCEEEWEEGEWEGRWHMCTSVVLLYHCMHVHVQQTAEIAK